MRLILVISFSLFSLSLFAQMAGGVSPMNPTPGEVKPNELPVGSYVGNVNLFTGEYQNSINLGTVSTPGGLSYSVDLNYSSKNSTSNQAPHLAGIPYGEGWNVSIPRITVQTVSKRFALKGREKNLGLKNQNYTNDSLKEEGEVYYYAPFLEIPGVASGRLILKHIDNGKATFILEKFEKYVEAILQGTVWTVKLDDGTVYVFDYMQKRLRAPSNNRIDRYYKDCVDRDTLTVIDTICVGRDSISPGGIPYGNCNDTRLVERLTLSPCHKTAFIDKGNEPTKELASAITPRTEIVSWFPSHMYNVRMKNQYIHFYYNTFGHFDFFSEYNQYGYQEMFAFELFNLLYNFDSNSISGIMPFLQDTTGGSAYISDQTLGMRHNPIKGYFTEIFLKSVVAVDNTFEMVPTQKLELEYETFDVASYQPGGGSSAHSTSFDLNKANLLLWKNDTTVHRQDSLFSYKVVYHKGKEDVDGILNEGSPSGSTTFFDPLDENSWSRYRHLRSDEFLYSSQNLIGFRPHSRYSIANMFDTWDSNGLNITSTKINGRNPYLGSIGGGILGQFYLGHEKAKIWDSDFIPFDNSILESERIKIRTVPGDYYELKTYVSTGGNFYPFNIDLNIISGMNTGLSNYIVNDPSIDRAEGNILMSQALGSDQLPAYRSDIPNRQYKIFSTFGNAVKWNPYMHTSSRNLITSNIFQMPNLPNEYEGFHIQIGPGSSDMYYNMGRYQGERNSLMPNLGGGSQNFFSSYNAYFTHTRKSQKVSSRNCSGYGPDDFSLYNQSLPIANGDENGFLLWDTDPIPQNFGNGQPWYMMDNLCQRVWSTDPVSSSYVPENPPNHMMWWNNTCAPTNSSVPPSLLISGSSYLPASGFPNRPTWAHGSANLVTVQMVRYAKNPYILKRAKFYKFHGHYDAFADYLGNQAQDSFIVSVKEFDYDIIQSQIPNNVSILSDAIHRNALKTYADGSPYFRNIFLLKSVSDVPIEDPGLAAITTQYGYLVHENLRVKSSNIQSNLSTTSLSVGSENCGTVILLNDITDPLGGHTMIEYQDTSNYLISNLYSDPNVFGFQAKCDGTWSYNYGPGIQPASINRYNIIIPVRFEKRWSETGYREKEYEFQNALSNYSSISANLRSIDASFNYSLSRSIFGFNGFQKTIVYEPPLDINQPYKRARTEYLHFGQNGEDAYKGIVLPESYCLAGKIEKQKHFDEDGILINEKTNTYKVSLAYKNYIYRRRIIRPQGWTNTHTHNDELSYGPVFWPGKQDKYGAYLDLTHRNSSQSQWASQIRIQNIDVPTLSVGLGQKMKFFESQYGGPNSYFVRLVKTEDKEYNYQSNIETGNDPVESGGSMENPYISNITEFNYYDADHKGLSNNPQYKKLLNWGDPNDTSEYIPLHDEHDFWANPEKIQWIPGVSPYAPSWPSSTLETYVADLRKNKSFEPSWQLSSTRSWSPQKPGYEAEEELYYYFDLQKMLRYRAVTSDNYASENYIPYFWADPKSDYGPVWFHYFHGFRTSPFQKRSIFKGPNGSETFREEYYEFLDYKSGILTASKSSADTVVQTIPQDYCDVLSVDTSGLSSMRIRNTRSYAAVPSKGNIEDEQELIVDEKHSVFTQSMVEEIPIDPGPQNRELLDNVYQNVAVLTRVMVQDGISKTYSGHNFTEQSILTRDEDFAFLDTTKSWIPTYDYQTDPVTGDTIDIDTIMGWTIGVMLKPPRSSFEKLKVLGRDRFGRAQYMENERGAKTFFHYPDRSYTLFVDPVKTTLRTVDYQLNPQTNEYEPIFGQVPCSYYSLDFGNPGYPDRIIQAYLHPDSLVTHYSYDQKLRLKKTKDPIGVERSYEYDGLNRLKKELLDGQATSTYQYNFWDGLILGNFDATAAQNFVESKNYLEPNEGIISQAFVDPLGKKTLSIRNSLSDIAMGTISGNSIYSGAIQYDEWGRGIEKYKAWKAGNSNFIYSLNYNTPNNTQKLEGSSRNRAIEAADFGRNLGDGHTVRNLYRLISLSDLEEELSLTQTEKDKIAPISQASYEFLRVEILDQDDKISRTYTDAMGNQVASSAEIEEGIWAITLFIYDEAGQLVETINPKKQSTTYKLNFLGQVYEKTNPDAGLSRYLYDKSGNILYEQDNVLANIGFGQARGSSFDVLGRKISQAKYSLNNGGPFFFGGNDERGMAWKDASLESSLVFSKQEKKWQYGRPITVVNNVHDKIFWPYSCGDGKAGLLNFSGSWDNDGNPVEYQFYSYDSLGRMESLSRQFNPNGISTLSSGLLNSIYFTYHYDGRLKEKFIDINTDLEIDLAFDYQYGRLGDLEMIRVGHGTDFIGKDLVGMEIDEALGLLARLDFHFPNDSLIPASIDSILYSYDPNRDRLKAMEGSFFEWKLYYDGDQADLSGIYDFSGVTPPSSGSFLVQDDNYNGNINASLGQVHLGSDKFSSAYGYKYDGINRLTNADALLNLDWGEAGDFTASNTQLTNQALDKLAIGDASYTYDEIGNFLNLGRTVFSGSNPYSGTNHLIAYHYQNGNNKLDRTAESTGTFYFTYDDNGNVLSHDARNISSATYGRANLPFTASINSEGTDYLYDEADLRIFKGPSDGSEPGSYYYLRDEAGKEIGRLDLESKDWNWTAWRGEERVASIDPAASQQPSWLGYGQAVTFANTLNPTAHADLDLTESNFDQYVLAPDYMLAVGGELTVLVDRSSDMDLYAGEKISLLPGFHFGPEEEVVFHAEADSRYFVPVSCSDWWQGNLSSLEMDRVVDLTYYNYDHLGNTRLTYRMNSGSQGLQVPTVERIGMFDYYPFGKELRADEIGQERFRYTGKERETESGLDYFLARNFDSHIGRFLGVDKEKEKFPEWTSYKISLCNPIKYFDPDGNTEEERQKALKEMNKLLGEKYDSKIPENNNVKEGQLDCSGSVRFCMMQNNSISDPFKGKTGNGVSRLVKSSKEVSLKNLQNGNIVVLKSGGRNNGHVGFIQNIMKDKGGNIESYEMIHSEANWTNATLNISGGGDVNIDEIKVGKEKGYGKSKYNHRYYKWDNPDKRTKKDENDRIYRSLAGYMNTKLGVK